MVMMLLSADRTLWTTAKKHLRLSQQLARASLMDRMWMWLVPRRCRISNKRRHHLPGIHFTKLIYVRPRAHHEILYSRTLPSARQAG